MTHTQAQHRPVLTPFVSARIPISEEQFVMHAFRVIGDPERKEHIALVLGDIQDQSSVLARIHSECLTGDVFGSQRCDCGYQLDQALQAICREGKGLLIYLRQEGRGIGLMEKLKSYQLQDQGLDTVEANLQLGHGEDERKYDLVPPLLDRLGVRSLRLITNNPAKTEACQELGIDIEERVAMPVGWHEQNDSYLKTKMAKMRHLLR